MDNVNYICFFKPVFPLDAGLSSKEEAEQRTSAKTFPHQTSGEKLWPRSLLVRLSNPFKQLKMIADSVWPGWGVEDYFSIRLLCVGSCVFHFFSPLGCKTGHINTTLMLTSQSLNRHSVFDLNVYNTCITFAAVRTDYWQTLLCVVVILTADNWHWTCTLYKNFTFTW